MVSQGQGADSASVVYDAVQSAASRGVDVVLADTAGRLQAKTNLMEELKKVQRVVGACRRARRTRCCWSSMPAWARTPCRR